MVVACKKDAQISLLAQFLILFGVGITSRHYGSTLTCFSTTIGQVPIAGWVDLRGRLGIELGTFERALTRRTHCYTRRTYLIDVNEPFLISL